MILIIILVASTFELANELWAHTREVKRRLRVGIILLGLMASVIAWYWQAEEQRMSAMTGRLMPPTVTERQSGTLTVQLGGNIVQLDLPELSRGQAIKPLDYFPFLNMQGMALSVRLDQGRPVVSARVRGWDGVQAAEIHENEWVINPGGVMERNYDPHGVEVIDSYGIPVLQLELLDRGTLRLSGVFWEGRSGGSITVVGDSCLTVMARPSTPADLDAIMVGACGVERWFLYPSRLHLGERRKPPYEGAKLEPTLPWRKDPELPGRG